jgi:aminoglycoside phosphotransferase family enzyme/predicted kinase
VISEEQLQDDLIRAFVDGQVAGAPAPVDHLYTHLSHVFLAGDRAIKLKRAVKLPFVDFSSSAQRRRACEAEIAVNRAMAGELYLCARPITYQAGRFQIGGEGEPVDWVVVMRRFDQKEQFDRLAMAGALSRSHVEAAALGLAQAHAATPPVEHAGYSAYYRQIIHELRDTEVHGARALGLTAGSAALFDHLDEELVRIGHLIDARRKSGKVRRGHGDFHLRNLCLWQGRPLAFDALEFDEALATSDVLYDLAFLLMDLRRVGLGQHANAAMNRYWDAAGEDEAALALLPFFIGLRAAVRMAVAVEAGELKEAQCYRTLGLDLFDRARPGLIAVGGLSGTGKSSVAQTLAACLPGPAGARLLRSDVLRKTREGLSLDRKADQASYAPERRAEIYGELARRASEAIGAGATVIADATFRETTTREAIEAAAGQAQFHACWLSAPRSVRLARVAGRAGDASDADVSVAQAQEEPSDVSAAWRLIDADRPVLAIVAEILEHLALRDRSKR